MRNIDLFVCTLALLCVTTSSCSAQQNIVPIAFGDFERWTVREIKESAVIGGNTRYIYAVAPNDTIRGEVPFKCSVSPWGTSNVLAKVSGIVKCSATVFPEKRGDGRCARLETRLEEVKVLNVINISVLASGSLFLGETVEPIKNTNNPNSKLVMGVPFTGCPKALQLDYKMKASGNPNREKVTGFSPRSVVPGKDYAILIFALQKRWEDANGNVYAKRVATATQRFMEQTPDWVNSFKINIRYGDFTSDSKAASSLVGLSTKANAYYCRNSKGVMVPINEVGWADEGDKPTHMVMLISSSYAEAYVGSVGNCLWVDNIKLVY